MNRTVWFFHPIFVFVLSTLALGTSLILYIYWYIEISAGLQTVVSRFNLDSGQVLAPQTWMVILVLSILVGIIMFGIFIIFVYSQKTLQLYRLQHNFINNFTHELKTPVTSLRLFLETFLKHDLGREEKERFTAYMLHDVSRLSENINRILNLAKLESKSYRGEFLPMDLLTVIRRFLDENTRLFKGARIVVRPPAEEALILDMDRPLMEMLLMNLINNAIAYNQSGTPVIEIAFETGKKRLSVRFADNGIGFEPGESRKLFKKFYQAGRSDNMTARGSGLGLYLVHNIARIHGGRITARSPGRGKGAVFTLALPYRKPPESRRGKTR